MHSSTSRIGRSHGSRRLREAEQGDEGRVRTLVSPGAVRRCEEGECNNTQGGHASAPRSEAKASNVYEARGRAKRKRRFAAVRQKCLHRQKCYDSNPFSIA